MLAWAECPDSSAENKKTNMSEPEKAASPSVTPSTPVKFRFEKSAGFRSIYAMGAWGRLNANSDIVMSLYQEIAPLPIFATYEQYPDGTWKQGIPKVELPPDYGAVRQIEMDIILSIEAAIRLKDNLVHFIRLAENDRNFRENLRKTQQAQTVKRV